MSTCSRRVGSSRPEAPFGLACKQPAAVPHNRPLFAIRPMPPPSAPPHSQHPRHRVWPWLLRGLAAVMLALVFTWYLSPHFVVDMAARFWSCI